MKKENEVKTQETRAEKIFYAVILSIGAIIILAIIMFNIPWGGDAVKISKEYRYLDKNNHVYETLEVNELKEKLDNAESFQLYIGNSNLEDVDYFVYYANELAKKYGVEKIYYINSKELKSEDVLYLKQNSIDELSIEVPSLIYYKDGKASRISSAEDFDKYYGSNYYLLLKDYFLNCYK